MFCQHCGALVPEGTTFCDDCSDRFAQLGQPPPQGLPQQQPPAPPDYPAQGGSGTQPATGQPAGGVAQTEQPYSAPGDAFANPQIAQYLTQESHGQYPATVRPSRTVMPARQRREALAVAYPLSLGVSGLLILVSTFLSWISVGFFGWSGWAAMIHGGELGGNFLFVSGEGILFFTGFWALLIGCAVMGGAAMLLIQMPLGGRIAQIAGGVGAVLMLINIITLVTHQGSTGVGVWLFLLFSIAAAILGELSIKLYH